MHMYSIILHASAHQSTGTVIIITTTMNTNVAWYLTHSHATFLFIVPSVCVPGHWGETGHTVGVFCWDVTGSHYFICLQLGSLAGYTRCGPHRYHRRLARGQGPHWTGRTEQEGLGVGREGELGYMGPEYV